MYVNICRVTTLIGTNPEGKRTPGPILKSFVGQINITKSSVDL